MVNKRGFTLIEVIVTLLVITVGVLGLVGVLSFVTGQGINAEMMTTSTLLSQERMEELIGEKRAIGYGSSPSLDIGTTVDPAFASPYADYTRTVEICFVDVNLQNPDCDPAAPNIDLGYKQITVTVINNKIPASSNTSVVSLVTDY